jgi:hypothetical protein
MRGRLRFDALGHPYFRADEAKMNCGALTSVAHLSFASAYLALVLQHKITRECLHEDIILVQCKYVSKKSGGGFWCRDCQSSCASSASLRQRRWMQKNSLHYLQRLTGCFANGNTPEERDVHLELAAAPSLKCFCHETGTRLLYRDNNPDLL